MKHLVIPDCQVRPGDDTTYLEHIGKYIVEKQPDVIVCIGDFADLPSLSSYDIGKKSFEGKRYVNDIASAHSGMEALLGPLWTFNKARVRQHKSRYVPRMVFTLGNHENRINKAVDNDAKLEGVLDINHLKYKEYGWEVFPFLEVVVIDGVAYSHYFSSGPMGRSCSSAQTQLRKANMSCVSGHQQGKQIAYATRADGKRITSIIAGSCYTHDEEYLNPQTNNHWRGVIVLHEVVDGTFDEMWVSLPYLKQKYG